MTRDWLIIATVFAVIWGMWKLFALVGDLIEIFWDDYRAKQQRAQLSPRDGRKHMNGKAL